MDFKHTEKGLELLFKDLKADMKKAKTKNADHFEFEATHQDINGGEILKLFTCATYGHDTEDFNDYFYHRKKKGRKWHR